MTVNTLAFSCFNLSLTAVNCSIYKWVNQTNACIHDYIPMSIVVFAYYIRAVVTKIKVVYTYICPRREWWSVTMWIIKLFKPTYWLKRMIKSDIQSWLWAIGTPFASCGWEIECWLNFTFTYVNNPAWVLSWPSIWCYNSAFKHALRVYGYIYVIWFMLQGT